MANSAVAFPDKGIAETILCFYVFVFCFLPTVFCVGYLQKLYLPVPGPDGFAFDLLGGGPYTSVADGRILKYLGPLFGFVEYGYSKADRPRRFCDGTNSTDNVKICGRPLGLGFYNKTGELYTADAGIGLALIGPGGGRGRQLVSGAEGVPFGIPVGLDVDQKTGIVYFTDASSRFNISQIAKLISTRDATGRLLKYDPRAKNVTVLLRGLAAASGVAISKDGSYLLVSEFVKARVLKYSLEGPLANTAKVLAYLTGSPGQIRRNLAGDFWIAVTGQSQDPTPTTILQGQRINGNGEILETITFSPDYDASIITEVQEYKRDLYLGSLDRPYVGVYRRF